MIAQQSLRDGNIAIGNFHAFERRRLVVFARFLKVLAIQRAAHRDLALATAADGADLAVHARAGAPGTPGLADCANHSLSIRVGRRKERMSRTYLFFKVEIDIEPNEQPQRIGDEICRRLLKLYGVRHAELSSYTNVDE